jgi:hypothetical protein
MRARLTRGCCLLRLERQKDEPPASAGPKQVSQGGLGDAGGRDAGREIVH